jgi:hypothetical protein
MSMSSFYVSQTLNKRINFLLLIIPIGAREETEASGIDLGLFDTKSSQ